MIIISCLVIFAIVVYLGASAVEHLRVISCYAMRIHHTVDRIEDKLIDLIGELDEEDFAQNVVFYAIVNGKKIRIDNMILKANEKFTATVAFKDKFGNAAQVDGIPSFSGDENLATLAPSEDGMSVVVTPKGPVGEFILQCAADADLGEGIKSILGELPVQILAGEAERVELTAGPAELQA